MAGARRTQRDLHALYCDEPAAGLYAWLGRPLSTAGADTNSAENNLAVTEWTVGRMGRERVFPPRGQSSTKTDAMGGVR